MHQNEHPFRRSRSDYYYNPPEREHNPEYYRRPQYGGRSDYMERRSYGPEYDQRYADDSVDRAGYVYDRRDYSRQFRDYDDPYAENYDWHTNRSSRNRGADYRAGNRIGERGLYPNHAHGYSGAYHSGSQNRDSVYDRDDYDPDDRGFMDKASDEVRSWFGDEEAERRRIRDGHRGKGPKGYIRSDSRIEEDVNDYLTRDFHVDASDISVSVSDCEVTLDGTTNSKIAKRRAEDCADAVSGVKHVQNNLRVELPSGQNEYLSARQSTPD